LVIYYLPFKRDTGSFGAFGVFFACLITKFAIACPSLVTLDFHIAR